MEETTVYDGLTDRALFLGETLRSEERGDIVQVSEIGECLLPDGARRPHVMLRSGLWKPFEARVARREGMPGWCVPGYWDDSIV